VANLVCSPNAAVAYDYLVSKGLRDFQAAAVIGNLQEESGLNPQLAVPDTNGLPSRGIAMWQPARWQNLLAFAAGRDPWALDTQLDFLWSELPSNGLAQLQNSSTLEDAVVVFQNQFERPNAALAHTDVRTSYARSALLSCPNVRAPESPGKGRVWWVAGTVAAVTAVGYGVYGLLRSRFKPEPEPPLLPRRRFRPPPDIEPEFDYRSRL
jgi:hypothetical protein